MAKKNKETPPEEETPQPLWKLLLFGIVGLVLIVWGSDVTVTPPPRWHGTLA